VAGDASESVKGLVSKSKWMLAFLIVTSLLAAFSFVYVCCDWSKSHKDSKSKSAEQQQQQLMSNVAPARFRASGGGGGGAFYPSSPFMQHGGGGAAGPAFHDRLEKQPVALAAPFPRYLYNPDQGHDTFQRASQPRRHQYHDGESAPPRQPPQQQQQHHHHRQEVSPPSPSGPLPEQQQQQQHGGDGPSAAALPPLPSLSDDASFTLFA